MAATVRAIMSRAVAPQRVEVVIAVQQQQHLCMLLCCRRLLCSQLCDLCSLICRRCLLSQHSCRTCVAAFDAASSAVVVCFAHAAFSADVASFAASAACSSKQLVSLRLVLLQR